MASIRIENVTVDFPIYESIRSFKRDILQKAGGLIKHDQKHNRRVTVRSLDDISFDVEHGDRIGLIGHNGAGKSTLLRVLAGVYEPVAGRLITEGHVSPLFNTSPGIVVDDTGYENIFTCGLFLGMSPREIETKVADIAEFSELGEYLFLPVRTYSTGMLVRLGFAIATAIDPEILLLDEGLGAGDARFAERANMRIDALIQRSSILVLASHSDNLIRSMCNKAVLMDQGKVLRVGEVNEVLEAYHELTQTKASILMPPNTASVSPRRWLDEVAKGPSLQSLKDSLRARYPFMHQGLPKRLAILGAGAEGRRLAEICANQGIEVAGVYDNDAGKRGIAAGKNKVVPSDAIGSLDRAVPVIIASHRVLGGTLMLRAMGFPVAPFAMLQVLAPDIFQPHMFYDGFVDDIVDNRLRYLELAEQLEDEVSLRVLDRVLGYRLTLDAALLAEVIDWDVYGFSGLVEFQNDEVYVDGGAYDGDSVRIFIDHVHGKYARILAFEPDPQTFKRLEKNLATWPRVEPINCGLHRAKAELRFNNDGSRGAIISDDGEWKINVVGLDEILAGQRVTFIKMNIEGAELEALRGGAESIRRWHPKLAISAYHRPSDLWEVPFAFRKIDPNYRLYLRQHDGGVIETVAYGIPRA